MPTLPLHFFLNSYRELAPLRSINLGILTFGLRRKMFLSYPMKLGVPELRRTKGGNPLTCFLGWLADIEPYQKYFYPTCFPWIQKHRYVLLAKKFRPRTLILIKNFQYYQLSSSRRATTLELPMAMRFRHLAMSAKEAVDVFKSGIEGRGLYCKREIQVD